MGRPLLLKLLLALALNATATGCTSDHSDDEWLGPVHSLAVQADAGSRYPHLGRDPGDHPVMSWLEPQGEVMALRYARWDGQRWGPSATAAQGNEWFVNWADFPSVIAAGPNHLAAHWLQQVPGNVYSYGVRTATSSDGGRTWSAPIAPHDDESPTEHGFVSLLPYEGAFLAVWLDGRHTMGDHEHGDHADAADGAMTLRSAMITYAGSRAGPDVEIDGRTCDCCQTSLALGASGPLVVYRDRGEDGTRDISILRFERGRWSAPSPVAGDGWRIDACPVNGPSVDARGNTVAVAWFTGAGGARVRLAFSADGGRSFGTPLEVDQGRVAGRVGVVLLDDGRAVVTWLRESRGNDVIVARPFTRRGAAGRAVEVAATGSGRAAGFPQVARTTGGLVFAWTSAGAETGIRTVAARLR